MADKLVVFGTEYDNVAGIKGTDDNSQTLTFIRPQGTKSISANGTGIDVAAYAEVDVAVPSPSPTLQTKSKSYTPSETAQSEAVTADNGYDGLDTVNVSVAAVSSTYVGSGITRRDSTDLSASGATVTAPAGYYASQATKTVSSGTAGTPSASKTIAGTTATITPSVTNTTGYITGSTKTGTAVTVTASEVDTLGTKSITSNGNNIDVVGYSAVNVSVSGTSKNTQVVQGTTRTTSSTLTAIGAEMTVSKTGTYDVYWSAFRSSTSSSYTYATQLFIDGAAYGSENATWSNHVQIGRAHV